MIDITAERLAALDEIRTWLKTPWVHQGRLKGRGVDCIGLTIAFARAANSLTPEAETAMPSNYSRLPHKDNLRRTLEKHMVRVSDHRDKALAGDVLLVAWRVHPTHLLILGNQQPGIITGPFNLIHAANDPDTPWVTEKPFRWDGWSVTGCYRFPRWA